MDWIKVTDRLPEPTTVVIVWLPLDGAGIGLRTLGYVYEGIWHQSTKPFKNEVTHWQPLPEPPKD